MKIRYTVALSMLAGTTIGGVATHSLHAQSKPPIYLIAQNEVINPEAYLKEFFVPILVIGGNITPLDRPPPKSRIVIQVWDSMEKLKA
jgi:hypothetical protein